MDSLYARVGRVYDTIGSLMSRSFRTRWKIPGVARVSLSLLCLCVFAMALGEMRRRRRRELLAQRADSHRGLPLRILTAIASRMWQRCS